MDISVIICTYNRSESLKRTLASLGQMSGLDSVAWELLVVDNNSSDGTRDAVGEFVASSARNCRYLFEEKQGLSNARNKGIQEAKGRIIAFTDDDVIVARDWIENILREFVRTDAACIGGKILPIWERGPQKWLQGELLDYLALLDLGDERIRLDAPTIWGANLIVNASIFGKYGLFDASLGHSEGKLYGGEEAQFITRLLGNGEDVYYSPGILVYHCIPAQRTTKSYFRKWVYDKGELAAHQMGIYRHRNLLGIPVYILRATLKTLYEYLVSQAVFANTAFRKQLTFIYYLGMVRGRVKRMGADYP